jgi:hypothetical protein
MQTLRWRKSSYSANGNGDCVELAVLPDGQVGIRDSKHPERGYLSVTRSELQAWIAGVKAGEFDDLSRITA